MPRGSAILADRRDDELFARRKGIRIAPSNIFTSQFHGIALGQLHEAHSRLKIRKIVFESRFQYLIKPGSVAAITLPSVSFNTMQAHESHALGSLLVIGRYHSTFAGCQR